MKRKLLSTVAIVFLLMVMVCTPILATIPLGSAYAESSAQVMAINEEKEAAKKRSRSYKENLDELHKKIDSLTPEKKNWVQKGISNVKKGQTLDKAASIGIQAAMEIMTNPDNVNYKNLCIDTCMGLINLAATCFGVGGIVDALLGPLAAIGKDKVPSEIEVLQEHIDEQFEIVNQGIEDIRNDISELSANMDKSLEEAVTALKDTIRDMSLVLALNIL